jgi:hypothetical protein
MKPDQETPGLPLAENERQRLQELELEVLRLRKTNEVLLDRVEHRINVEGGAFAAFQAASNLEKTVADRTTELRLVNERLEHELDLRRSFETALLKAKAEAEEATASRTRFVGLPGSARWCRATSIAPRSPTCTNTTRSSRPAPCTRTHTVSPSRACGTE